MINEKIFGVVKKSMLSDRNLENGTITEQKITEKFIQIIIKEHGDVVTIKRETKENLITFWNLSIMQDGNYKNFIEKYKITFSEFRNEMEKVIEEVDIQNIDIQELVGDVLKDISDTKLVPNEKR
jgi:hypothetical protein